MSYCGYGPGSKLFGSTAQPNTNAPTFGGVTGATAGEDGSITASWSPATGSAATPIRYRVYAALGANVPATSLFVSANIVGESASSWTELLFFQLGDQATYLVNGLTYTVGVRAFSAQNVADSNDVTLNVTAIASANLPSVLQALATAFANTEALLETDHTNFQSDHSNFVSDHENFESDHSNFVTDNENFETDHTNFETDHSNFESDHSNFETDHSNFQQDHENFQEDNTELQAAISDLESKLQSSSQSVVIGVIGSPEESVVGVVEET